MKTIEEMKSFPAARKNYRPEKVEKLSEEQMKWFRDAKFGMFIHWGVYSMLGKGEWVLMNEHLDVRKYETLKDDFLAEILMRNSGQKCKGSGDEVHGADNTPPRWLLPVRFEMQ